MSEDELIMAMSVIHKDINDNEKTLSKVEGVIADLERQLARQELIYNTTRDALKWALAASVVSLAEVKSLKVGVKTSGNALGELKSRRLNALVVRNKALAALPGLRRELQRLESQPLPEPPRVVLEFRRDK